MSQYECTHTNYRRTGTRIDVDVDIAENRSGIIVTMGGVQCVGAIRLDGSVAWSHNGEPAPAPISEYLDRVHRFEGGKRSPHA